MWMFTVYGFFSIVCIKGNPDELMVRARAKDHLVKLKNRFPLTLGDIKILEWKNRDYPCRIIVPKNVWVPIVAELTKEIAWNNFKDECGVRFGKYSKYVNALHHVWSQMFEFSITRSNRRQDAGYGSDLAGLQGLQKLDTDKN